MSLRTLHNSLRNSKKPLHLQYIGVIEDEDRDLTSKNLYGRLHNTTPMKGNFMEFFYNVSVLISRSSIFEDRRGRNSLGNGLIVKVGITYFLDLRSRNNLVRKYPLPTLWWLYLGPSVRGCFTRNRSGLLPFYTKGRTTPPEPQIRNKTNKRRDDTLKPFRSRKEMWNTLWLIWCLDSVPP